MKDFLDVFKFIFGMVSIICGVFGWFWLYFAMVFWFGFPGSLFSIFVLLPLLGATIISLACRYPIQSGTKEIKK
jgi:hypothetical protein